MVDQDSSRIKPRCKVGDLAFVIKVEKHHSNLGKIVKVIREAKPIVDFADEYNGLVWMVESEGGFAGDHIITIWQDRSLTGETVSR